MNENKVLTYPELLKEIEGNKNNLLVANGFNRGLGINTSYEEIFKKMLQGKHGKVYENVEDIVKQCKYDLEGVIAKLNESIDSNNEFLKKYVNNKVKLDFMQATQEIVNDSLKNVYSEKNNGIFLLLKNFTNYFTLNYDSFLYLLLMNFKKNDGDSTSIIFTPQLKIIQKNLDVVQNNIYSEIKNLREKGTLDISASEKNIRSDLSLILKSDFVTTVKIYGKSSGKSWKMKDIEKVVGKILQEEKNNQVLENVDDGFKQTSLFDIPVHEQNNKLQNLFFLHGAFHIKEDKNKTVKITSTENKALYDKLEEVLNNDELEICTVFQPKNKIDSIRESKYLSHCIDKLNSISGNMVIIGSSLDENDNHIFEAINNSSVDKVYISSFENFKKDKERAKKLFSNKEICLFNAKTISYSIN